MSDVPVTPVYGLPHERGVTLPGRTLTGGPTGDDPILAEAVEAEVERVDGDVVDLQQAIAALPRVVDQGEITEPTSNSGINIPVPSGEFIQLRLTLRGHCSALTQVGIRINDDSTNMYLSGRVTRRASDGEVTDTHHNDSGSMFLLGEWSTLSANNAVIDFFNTHDSQFISHQARVARMSTNPVNHRISDAWGRITESRLLTHINVRTNTVGEGYNNLFWQLVGIPSP